MTCWSCTDGIERLPLKRMSPSSAAYICEDASCLATSHAVNTQVLSPHSRSYRFYCDLLPNFLIPFRWPLLVDILVAYLCLMVLQDSVLYIFSPKYISKQLVNHPCGFCLCSWFCFCCRLGFGHWTWEFVPNWVSSALKHHPWFNLSWKDVAYYLKHPLTVLSWHLLMLPFAGHFAWYYLLLWSQCF